MVVEDCKGRLCLCGSMPRTSAVISIKLSPNISGFQSVKRIDYSYSQKLMKGALNDA